MFKKILSILNDYYYTYLYKTFLWRINNFYNSLKNIIRWIPVIYNDKDWDHYYILRLLDFKLKNIKKRYEKHELFVGQEQEIYWLNICLKLLNILLENKTWEDTEENKHLNIKNIKYLKKYPELINLIHWKCDAREEKINDLFWKIISWRNRYWWD